MVKSKAQTVHKTVRLKKWIVDAIQQIADSKGLTFTVVAEELLRQELAAMGHNMGIGREASFQKEKPVKKKAG